MWLISTLPGRALLAVLVIMGTAGAAYWQGRQDGRGLCNAEKVEAELRQAQADIRRIAAAAKDAHDASERLASERLNDQERIAQYERDLLTRGARPACRITPDDVRSLRDILPSRLPQPPPRS